MCSKMTYRKVLSSSPRLNSTQDVYINGDISMKNDGNALTHDVIANGNSLRLTNLLSINLVLNYLALHSLSNLGEK